MKKTKFFITCLFLIGCVSANAETVFDSYTNIYDDRLAAESQNTATDKNKCIQLLKKLQTECRTVTVNGKKQEVCVGPGSTSTIQELFFYNMYCSGITSEQNKEAIKNQKAKESKTKEEIFKFKSYNENKNDFWIPQDINPILQNDEALQVYRIFDISDIDKYEKLSVYLPYKQYSNWGGTDQYAFRGANIEIAVDNQILKKQINNVKEKNRPFLWKDFVFIYDEILKVNKVKSKIKSLNNSSCNVDGSNCVLSDNLLDTNEMITYKYKSEYNRILNEYGESVFGDDFKQELEKYRERSSYFSDADIESYYMELPKLINENWFYLGNIQDGILLITIAKDGTLLDAKMDRTLGSFLADESVLRAVKKTKFKPLPESLNVKSIVFSVKIPFKNNESSQNGIPTLSSYGEHPKWVFNK